MTQSKVFVYNMQKLAMVKKLLSASDGYSCVAVHPYGDHIVIGTHDKKVLISFILGGLA
jgi:ribosome biogenesis protein ERB1